MDYFQYLSETYTIFKKKTKEEILSCIKDTNNTIHLINDIKNFIFSHEYVLNINLVTNYLLYIHNFSKEIDNILINKILDYYKLEDYKHIFDKKNLSFKAIEFKLLENGVDLEQLYFENQVTRKQTSTFFIPFLSEYIFERLLNVIIIERENLYVLLNKGEILCNYNNFYVPSQCNYKSICKINNLPKEPNTKYFVLNEHIKYFSFSTPYKKEEYKAFEFDIKVLHDYKNVLTKESLLSLIKDLQKYKNIVNDVILFNQQKQFTNEYSSNQMIIFNNNIHQSYFKEQNIDNFNNYNITYQNLEHFFNQLYKDSTIFIHKNDQINNILSNEMINVDNTLFIVFKIFSPFYNLKLDTIINVIDTTLRNNLISNITTFNVSNILFYVNVIYTFFKEINFHMSYDTLPLTDYSNLIFKIFLDMLFLELEEHNFIYFETQFIVYGTRKQALATFNKIQQILKKHNINIVNIQIYDKLFHNDIEVFDKKLPFTNIVKSYLFKNIDIEDEHNLNIKKNIIIKKGIGLDDNESNLIINIDDPISE